MRACAYATGQSWDKTYWELADVGFEMAEMPSWNATWWDYLKHKGFTRHIIPDTCPFCYTVDDFCEDHPEGLYVLFIPYSSGGSGHVVAVDEGDVIDTWDSRYEIPLAYWQKGE